MPTQKSEDKNIRKITKLGGHSYGITLPIEYVKELGWRERQKVVVEKYGDELIVRDWEE